MNKEHWNSLYLDGDVPDDVLKQMIDMSYELVLEKLSKKCLKKLLEEIVMIESRCGILCSECEYKEPMKCNGCVNIAKPFWGEQCPVKSCCEGKALEYCGKCEGFPCDLLTQFSYDKEQGDNGKRIEQCKEWAS